MSLVSLIGFSHFLSTIFIVEKLVKKLLMELVS